MYFVGILLHLGQVLLAQRAVGVVVQAALQTLEAEGVSTGRRHRLVEQPGEAEAVHRL